MTPKTLAKASPLTRHRGVRAGPIRCLDRSEEKAISKSQARLRCVQRQGAMRACHEGWNFTMRLPGHWSAQSGCGRAQFVRASSRWNTRSRRRPARIARRAPYMHDGSLATLEQVVEHYDHGGVDRPSRSDLMRPLGLTVQEKSDLVAFLQSLTSNLAPTAAPVLPR